jgi:hypothetical protein
VPHAAFAQPVQNTVGTQEKIVATPLEKLIRLIGGEPAALDQIAGQDTGIGELRVAAVT